MGEVLWFSKLSSFSFNHFVIVGMCWTMFMYWEVVYGCGREICLFCNGNLTTNLQLPLPYWSYFLPNQKIP